MSPYMRRGIKGEDILLMGKVSKQSSAYLYNCPDGEKFEVLKRL